MKWAPLHWNEARREKLLRGKKGEEREDMLHAWLKVEGIE